MNAAALVHRFKTLPPHLRIGGGVLVAALIAGFSILANLMHDDRVALFSGALHPDQLAEVEERLAEWSVPFTAAADNVSVEARRRSELLLRLSLAGVPHSHIDTSGELLSKVGALTPQSVIEQQSRDGLSADLELALRGIDGVQDATVIIAPEKPAVFADEQSHDATASVRLHLRSGVHLAPTAISGIRSFVAAGVPGLDSKHVTIVDDRGIALSDEGNAGVDAPELQASLQSALDAAFGAGTSIVRVHAEYDQRAQQLKEVRRIAASTVPITSEQNDEHYGDQGRHYTKSARTDDRGSDVREEQTSVPAGRLSRISVAVAVDAAHANELYQIRALATAAAGLNMQRGDTISVEAVAFHAPQLPKTNALPAAYGALLTILPSAIVGVIVLIALRLCLKPAAALVNSFAARSAIVQTRNAVAGFAPAQVRGVLRDEPPHAAAAIISALPAATAAAVLDLYPPEERSAIIRRMSRPRSPLVPDCETVIANA